MQINSSSMLSAPRWVALVTLGFTVGSFSIPAVAASITNGSFEMVGTNDSYSIDVDFSLPGWSAGTPGPTNLNCLVYAGDTTSLCGSPFGGGLTFWQNPGPSPNGGNYVAIDGDTNFSTPLTQTVDALIIGNTYVISFFQAAAQQSGFDGDTTERWQVRFGSESKLSTQMFNASHGKVDWMAQSLTFTATAASQLLSFIAVGTPNGVPPFVLLDGVAINAAVPEPASIAIVGLGLIGLGYFRMKKRNR